MKLCVLLLQLAETSMVQCRKRHPVLFVSSSLSHQALMPSAALSLQDVRMQNLLA